jgi:hypothetical protein
MNTNNEGNPILCWVCLDNENKAFVNYWQSFDAVGNPIDPPDAICATRLDAVKKVIQGRISSTTRPALQHPNP